MPQSAEQVAPDRRNSQDDDNHRIAAALALRSFHLPGYSFMADWWQYMVNHHPVWGICWHHRLHPLELRMRILYLIGSVMFGLAVTNCMWLAFIFAEVDQSRAFLTLRYGEEKEETEFNYYNNSNSTYHWNDDDDNNNNNSGSLFQNNGEIVITDGMIVLWTIGGTLHAMFDQTIWFITTCPCCLPGQFLECCLFARQYTRIVAVVAVVMATAVATLAVLLRASLQMEETSQNTSLKDLYDQGGMEHIQSITAYDFLLTYGIELSLSYLVYYPLLGTLFFSGILGCYRVPILGGRPYEMKQEERRMKRRQSNSWRHRSSSSSG